MISLWIVYAVATSAVIGVTALAAERALQLLDRPQR